MTLAYRTRLLVFGVSLGVLLGLSSQGWLAAEEPADRASRSSRPAAKRGATEGLSSDEAIKLARKLDELIEQQETVLKNQQTILQKFDAVMEELRIVKVRSLIGTGN